MLVNWLTGESYQNKLGQSCAKLNSINKKIINWIEFINVKRLSKAINP